MDLPEFQALTTTVLWAAFGVAFVFGAIAQVTHFCTMGAISDVVNMGDWTRARQWVAAIGVAMIGFGAMVYAGWIDPARTLYASNRVLWLSGIVGGLMFGFGMVLSSGCGSKTLVRIGAGNLKAVVVFLAMAVGAFATLKGVTAVLRVATVDKAFFELTGQASVPGLAQATLGWPAGTAALLGVVIGLALLAWALSAANMREGLNLLAGLGIGATIAALWWVTGKLGFVAEHPETLQEAFAAASVTGRSESLTFTAPMAYTLDWLLFFSDKSKVLTVGVVAVLGVVVGACVAALLGRTFRWEGFGGTEDLANHLAGGLLMGVGGVTALGCTVGQGLSGISTLSLTSFFSVGGIVVGAWLAFKYQTWRIERMMA